jgi:opine dehydrogenase
MIVAIFGAGSVALANAVWLAREGHEVRLWSAVEEERGRLAAAGVIEHEGIVSGSARITVAADPGAAVAGADVVMVAAPAFAHAALMHAAAPNVTPEQLVVVHPVTGLSSMLMSRLLKERGVKPTIADLSTSLFTTRRQSTTKVRILRIKELIDVATIPADRGEAALGVLRRLYGDRFRLEPNALAISLNNHNPVYHVPPLLCNLSRAEKAEDWIIWDSITPGVARFVKLVDDERLAVVRHYGTREIPVDQYFRQSFGVDGRDLDEIFPKVTEKLKGPIGPQQFDHRFVTEDVPYALVFYWSLGKVAGIEMPLTECLIKLTSAIWQRDFIAEGHTMERLGLAGKSSREILRAVAEGF